MTVPVAPRVVFGALALRPGGSGVQTYERELVHAVRRVDPRRELSAVVQSDAVADLPVGVDALSRPVSDGMRRALDGLRPVAGGGLFHALDVDLPLRHDGPCVTTVHDMSVFDTPWASGRVRATGERMLVRRSLRRADAVVAVSGFTAERIRAVTGRESTVIPLAPARWARVPTEQEVESVRRKYRLPDRFVFQMGTLEPRKRPDVVTAAARALGVETVLAGAGTDGPGCPPGARGLGYVDLADVPALYRAADVVAYASVYEGFGLPPVEAMACGGVVVASGVGAIPEAAAGGAVVVADRGVGAWTDALRTALEDGDLRRELRTRGRRVATARSWDDVARETLAVYDTLH